jgi:hypothetical protein
LTPREESTHLLPPQPSNPKSKIPAFVELQFVQARSLLTPNGLTNRVAISKKEKYCAFLVKDSITDLL